MRLCRPSLSSFSSSPRAKLEAKRKLQRAAPFQPSSSSHESAPAPSRALHTVGVTASVAAAAPGGIPAPAAAARGAAVTPPTSASPTSEAPTTTVEFFFDILSPYSYFAFETLCRYRDAGEWNIALQLKPCFLSAIMQRTSNSPPGMVPAKGSYMRKDLQRLSEYFAVPIMFPRALKEVMFGSLGVQRILAAVARDRPERLEAATRAFWQRHWGRDQDILSREGQTAALTAAGFTEAEAEAVLHAATTPEVKQLLQSYTEEALAYGAFGVPSMVLSTPASNAAPAATAQQAPAAAAQKQLLFGSDRFHVMAAMLRKEWTGPRPRPAKKRILSRL